MGRSDSRARFPSVIDSLGKLAPFLPASQHGSPRFLFDPLTLALSALTPGSPQPASVHCFGRDVGFTVFDQLTTSIFSVTRLISVRFRYSSAFAPRSSDFSVAAAAVQVASC